MLVRIQNRFQARVKNLAGSLGIAPSAIINQFVGQGLSQAQPDVAPAVVTPKELKPPRMPSGPAGLRQGQVYMFPSRPDEYGNEIISSKRAIRLLHSNVRKPVSGKLQMGFWAAVYDDTGEPCPSPFPGFLLFEGGTRVK